MKLFRKANCTRVPVHDGVKDMSRENVNKVVVVGAGTMGHSIAQVFARAGIEVNLVDADQKILDHAIELIGSNLNTMAEWGMLEKDKIPEVMKRVHTFVDLDVAAREVDFAIEAVPEIPDLKKKIFAQLDQSLPQDVIMASNTSGLDIFDIADVKDPSRLVVAHWFAPAHIIPLVEVVPGPKTSPAAVTFTTRLMEEIGKKVVVMKKFAPLFIVNRIQKSIVEAVYEILQNDWATPEEIDIAVKSVLGVRLPIVGVVQTLDFNGLDTVVSLNRRDGISLPLVEECVKQGYLGAKTSKGIYDYNGRSETEILRKRDKLFLSMIDHLEKIKAFEPV
jgi:3-hydroxybutyryl-CoA dehydrogenase